MKKTERAVLPRAQQDEPFAPDVDDGVPVRYLSRNKGGRVRYNKGHAGSNRSHYRNPSKREVAKRRRRQNLSSLSRKANRHRGK